MQRTFTDLLCSVSLPPFTPCRLFPLRRNFGLKFRLNMTQDLRFKRPRRQRHCTTQQTLPQPTQLFLYRVGPEPGLVSSCSQLPSRGIPGLNCPEQPHPGPPLPCPQPHLAQECHSCAGLQLLTALPWAPRPSMAS